MGRVDLAIVIACFGLVLGLALPSQSELAHDARRQAVHALARNTDTALELTRRRWEEAGRPVTVDGAQGPVAVVNGAPSVATLPLIVTPAESAGFSYDNGHWTLDGVKDCSLSYAPPARDGQDPLLTVTIYGC